MFQMKRQITLLIFCISLIHPAMPFYAMEISPISTIQCKNPGTINADTYLYQVYVDDPHSGIFLPQLILVNTERREFLTNAVDTDTDVLYNSKNNTLCFKNEFGGFLFNLTTCKMEEREEFSSGAVRIAFPFRDRKKRAIAMDDYGIYYTLQDEKTYLLLFNACAYALSQSRQFLAILVNAYYTGEYQLFLYNLKNREIFAIDKGKIMRPGFVSDKTISYIKEAGIITYNIITKQQTAFALTADYYQFMDERNLLYTNKNVLYKYNTASGKNEKILEQVTGSFQYSQANQLVVYDRKGALCFYYLNDDGDLGRNINILDNYEHFECTDEKILVLKAEYRRYKDDDKIISFEVEILFLEIFDKNGYLIGIKILNFLNDSNMITTERTKNAFAVYKGEKIVYTYSSCRAIKMTDWTGK